MVLAIAVFLVGWVVVLPPAAAKGGFVTYDAGAHRFTVSPTGADDTANIQAAFDGCAAGGLRCTVQLTGGTFHTAQIVAWNFQGSFQGMGPGKTTVQALPDLPVSKDAPFNLNLPGASNPWPNLFTFFDGTYSISGMTFTEPYAKPMQPYRAFDTVGKIDALYAFVSVTGVHANVTVEDVAMVGAPGDLSYGAPFLFNVVNGIFPQALLLQPGSTISFDKPRKGPVGDLLPLQVNFRTTDSAFHTIDGAISFEDLVDSTVLVSRNTFETVEWAIAAFYMSNSVSTVSKNVARNVMGHYGVEAFNGGAFSTLIGCERPSQIFVTDNDFQAAVSGGGVALLDFGPFVGCGLSLDAVVTGNTIRTEGAGNPAIWSAYLVSTVVEGNTILGPGPWGVVIIGGGSVVGNAIRGSVVGIILDLATGVIVQGNEVTNSGQWGIAVVDGSSNNVIEQNTVSNSGQFDLYWDGTGTGNVWTGNVCQTSSPPGLCL